jgi:hypothetical protein
MYQDEYNSALKKLKHKWPNIFSEDQITMMWERWRDLPDDIFKNACDMILFKCTAIPSGERIQEEINNALDKKSKSTSSFNSVRDNGCKKCRGQGYLTAINENSNEVLFLCHFCNGKNLKFNYPMPTYRDVQHHGYFLKVRRSNVVR